MSTLANCGYMFDAYVYNTNKVILIPYCGGTYNSKLILYYVNNGTFLTKEIGIPTGIVYDISYSSSSSMLYFVGMDDSLNNLCIGTLLTTMKDHSDIKTSTFEMGAYTSATYNFTLVSNFSVDSTEYSMTSSDDSLGYLTFIENVLSLGQLFALNYVEKAYFDFLHRHI